MGLSTEEGEYMDVWTEERERSVLSGEDILRSSKDSLGIVADATGMLLGNVAGERSG